MNRTHLIVPMLVLESDQESISIKRTLGRKFHKHHKTGVQKLENFSFALTGTAAARLFRHCRARLFF